MRDSPGSLGTARQIGWLVSLGGATLIAIQTPSILHRVSEHAPWWTLAAAGAAIAVIALAVGGRVMPNRVLRVAWIGIPALGWALWLASFPAYLGDAAEATMPWIWVLQPMIVSYPVLWARPAAAVLMAVGAVLLPAASALLAFGAVPDAVIADAPIHASNIAFAVVLIHARARLDLLRVAEEEARAQELAEARATVEAERLERLGRLIHDEVLSVLTAAMSFTGGTPEQLRAEARRTLALLEGPGPVVAAGSCTSEAALEEIATRLLDIDPTCPVHAHARPGDVDAEAVAAVIGAASEALRNGIRHAGRVRSLEARVGPGSIRVVVSDDGPGFDVDAIDPARRGVRDSILGRMSALEGGRARIRTAPGRGTVVELTWRA